MNFQSLKYNFPKSMSRHLIQRHDLQQMYIYTLQDVFSTAALFLQRSGTVTVLG
jgi:hypothetical protein